MNSAIEKARKDMKADRDAYLKKMDEQKAQAEETIKQREEESSVKNSGPISDADIV